MRYECNILTSVFTIGFISLIFQNLSWTQFQVEHCNEAESLVAGIEACAGKGEGEEDEVEILCKLAQVHLLYLYTN